MFFNLKSCSSTPRTPASLLSTDSASLRPRLSKEKINEIINSPFETNYTYSDSIAYKPHFGSSDYIHPRLCRRYSRHWLSVSARPSADGLWSNFIECQNCRKCHCKCMFWLLLLCLLLIGYISYGSRCHQTYNLENFEQTHENFNEKQLSVVERDFFGFPPTVFVPNCSCVTVCFVPHTKKEHSKEIAEFAVPSLNNYPLLNKNGTRNTNESAISQSDNNHQLEVIGSLAFRERFVLQFFVVDYLPFNVLHFWNFNMSFSFVHP